MPDGRGIVCKCFGAVLGKGGREEVETRLNTQEVARLYGKDERTIRRWAESGKLQADKILNEFNSPEYLFSVDSLDPPQQKKY